jgi:hypothetical protein
MAMLDGRDIYCYIGGQCYCGTATDVYWSTFRMLITNEGHYSSWLVRLDLVESLQIATQSIEALATLTEKGEDGDDGLAIAAGGRN